MFIDEIVGQTITEVALNGYFLLLHTQLGVWRLEARGDCCSHSYWYRDSFEGLDNLFESEVIRAEDMKITGGADLENGYCLEIYAIRLHTAKGTATLEMRNESNGYYGGHYEAHFKARP